MRGVLNIHKDLNLQIISKEEFGRLKLNQGKFPLKTILKLSRKRMRCWVSPHGVSHKQCQYLTNAQAMAIDKITKIPLSL